MTYCYVLVGDIPNISRNAEGVPWVKGYLAPLAAALAISLVASVASAQALTFQRVCKYSFGTTTDGRWTTVPPYYIHITARADSYIAAHAGMVEGRPVFNKPSQQVPCSVAESVSHKAIRAWEGWGARHGQRWRHGFRR